MKIGNNRKKRGKKTKKFKEFKFNFFCINFVMTNKMN